jgi:hypothetical protein
MWKSMFLSLRVVAGPPFNKMSRRVTARLAAAGCHIEVNQIFTRDVVGD